jgi:hypothetical protein
MCGQQSGRAGGGGGGGLSAARVMRTPLGDGRVPWDRAVFGVRSPRRTPYGELRTTLYFTKHLCPFRPSMRADFGASTAVFGALFDRGDGVGQMEGPPRKASINAWSGRQPLIANLSLGGLSSSLRPTACRRGGTPPDYALDLPASAFTSSIASAKRVFSSFTASALDCWIRSPISFMLPTARS